MRIAFVYPATQFDIAHHKDSLPNGLLSLIAVLERDHGRNVDLFDARFGPALPGPEYDVVGFTCMSMQISHSMQLVDELRAGGFAGKLIFGGPHASVAPEHLMSNPHIDAVFIGEAERTLPEYLRWLEGDTDAKLARLWRRREPGDPHGVIEQKTRLKPCASIGAMKSADELAEEWVYEEGDDPLYVADLDTLPFPARHKLGFRIRETRFINMFAARGCPFNCNFCQPTKRILFGNAVRRRSPENIVAEIDDAVQRFGITGFSIDDDTFTFNRKSVLRFCELIEPYNMPWSCQSRSDIDEDVLEAMRKAGCWLVFVGVESGSQRVLNLMNKKNTVGSNFDFITRCNKLGIKTWCNIILGYPGETEEDMEQTYRFVMDSQPTRACVSQATPFPGTDLYERHFDDLNDMYWDDIARHVFRPKFKSMSHLQPRIDEYMRKCSVGWDKPLVP